MTTDTKQQGAVDCKQKENLLYDKKESVVPLRANLKSIHSEEIKHIKQIGGSYKYKGRESEKIKSAKTHKKELKQKMDVLS